MVEYGLMVALIAVVCILVIAALGQEVGHSFDRSNIAMEQAGPHAVTPSP
jgi:Flp pilus assembly pilin Flp